MTAKSTFIAITTAAAIGLGTLAPVSSATAAPFTPFQAAAGESATQVTEVGSRSRRHRRRANAAGAVALGLGAFALGAAIAGSNANARPARECCIERVRVWSPRHQAYVIRKERVCY